MTTNLQTAERKTADKQYADSHPDRGGNEQYERYINRG